MGHTKLVNRAYTLNSTLIFYILFENYKISYSSSHFSSLHNFVMFKDICKWDPLPFSYIERVRTWHNGLPQRQAHKYQQNSLAIDPYRPIALNICVSFVSEENLLEAYTV